MQQSIAGACDKCRRFFSVAGAPALIKFGMAETKKRVLLLTTELEMGGTERALLNLARSLDCSGYEVFAASLRGDGPVDAMLEEAGVPVFRLAMSGKFDFAVVGRLAKILRDEKIDVLHTFLFHANIVGRLAGRKARTPVVISSVRLCERRPHRLLLDGLTHFMIDAATCVSQETLEYTARYARVPRRKLTVIPNGIAADFAAGADEGRRVRESLGIPPDVPVVLTVTRLAAGKGIDLLRRIAKNMIAKRDDVHFVVAGAGRYLDCLCGMAGERLHVLGHRTDIPALLAAADVFFLPSRREGMPNVILEAMAAGLPVVAFDVRGCRGLVADGNTGLLAPRGDWRSASLAIERLLDESETRARMGCEAERIAREKFSLDATVRLTEELYRRLLEKKRK